MDCLINSQLSAEEIVANLFATFVAGHETTGKITKCCLTLTYLLAATTLTWLMYFLSQSADIQQKCRLEIVNTLKNKNIADITLNDVSSC